MAASHGDERSTNRIPATPDEPEGEFGHGLKRCGRGHRQGLRDSGGEQTSNGDGCAQRHQRQKVRVEPTAVAKTPLHLFPRRLIGVIINGSGGRWVDQALQFTGALRYRPKTSSLRWAASSASTASKEMALLGAPNRAQPNQLDVSYSASQLVM
jgi:hypothetical protein